MGWEDAGSLVRRSNEEAFAALPEPAPNPRDFLQGLPKEARIRLWEVLENRAMHPGRRGPRRHRAVALEGPPVQPGSAGARAVAMLEADPQVSYAEVARAIGTSYSNVRSVACRAGLQRKAGKPGRGTRGKAA